MKATNEKPAQGRIRIFLIGIFVLMMVCLVSSLVSSWIGQKRFLSLREKYQEMANSSQFEIIILEERIGEKKLDDESLDLVFIRLLNVEWDGIIAWSEKDKYVDLLFRHIESDGTSTEEIFQDLYVGEEIEYHGYKIKLLRIEGVDRSPWNILDSSTYGFFEVTTEQQGSTTLVPTPTPTPTAVLVPTPQPTVPPTRTATEVVEETPFPTILGLSQPLSELLINWKDIEEYYDQNGIHPQITVFFEDSKYTMRDASGEITDNCLLECTRQIWRTETRTDIGFDDKEFEYYYEAIIEIYLHKDKVFSSEHAEILFIDFLSELSYEYFPDDGWHSKVSAPEQNTRIGLLNPREDGSGMVMLVTTSTGPISYRVTSNIPPWHDDGTTHLQVAIDFLNTQINQVEKAYIIATLPPNVQETDYVAFWELHSTPMGDGFLADHLLLGPHASEYMHTFRGSSDPWFTGEEEGSMSIIVYAGVSQFDQQQGMLIVVRKGTIWGFFGDHIDLPTRSGRPEIVDAVGKRLVIETEMGDIFYFDVPSGKFANSLTEVLPTMTPGPTLTPRVTATP